MNINWSNLTLRKVLFRVLPKFIGDRLEGKENIQNILLNVNWLFIEKIIKTIVGVFVVAWQGRYLGPEKTGILFWSISFVAMFGVLAQFSNNSVLVKYLSTNIEDKNTILGSAFFIRIIGIIVLWLIVPVAYFVMKDFSKEEFLVVLVICLGYLARPFDTIDFLFQSKLLSKYIVFSRIFAFLCIYGLKIILILYNAPLIYFAWSYSLDSLIAAIGFVYFNYSKTNNFIAKWKVSKVSVKIIFRESWPLAFSGILISFLAQIDQVMIGNVLSANETGQFGVARNFVDLLGFLPMIIVGSVAPSIAVAKMNDEKLYQKKLLITYQILFYFSVLIIIGLLLGGKFIINVMYGENFAYAGYLLSIMGLRFLFASFGALRGLFIVNNNLQKFSFYSLIVASGFNIVLNYLTLPIWGSVGAIISTYVSFFIGFFVFDLIIKPFRVNFKLMIKAVFSFQAHFKLIKRIIRTNQF